MVRTQRKSFTCLQSSRNITVDAKLLFSINAWYGETLDELVSQYEGRRVLCPLCATILPGGFVCERKFWKINLDPKYAVVALFHSVIFGFGCVKKLITLSVVFCVFMRRSDGSSSFYYGNVHMKRTVHFSFTLTCKTSHLYATTIINGVRVRARKAAQLCRCDMPAASTSTCIICTLDLNCLNCSICCVSGSTAYSFIPTATSACI